MEIWPRSIFCWAEGSNVLPKALNSKLHTIRQHFLDVLSTSFLMQVECFTLIEVFVRDTGDILELEVIVEVVASKVHVKGKLEGTS